MSDNLQIERSSASKEALTLFVLYSTLIVGTMWWSGTVTAPTVYDKYLVKLEGMSIRVKNLERAIPLYRDVLSFGILPAEGTDAAGFLLPDRRKLFVKLAKDEPGSAEVVLRVRNGFNRLYDRLKGRIEELKDKSAGAAISPITPQAWGEEFVITDYDGNRFVYFLPRRRSTTRLE